MIKAYPPIRLELSGDDVNPAIQLFGRRFFADQTILELLVEFLLVVLSEKRIGKESFDSVFPDYNLLDNWPKEHELAEYACELQYAPPARLGLKLFSFLGASKLETRHESHRVQYQVILERLRRAIDTSPTNDKNDILRTLENLFFGFQGVGQDRTWSAQTFLPISSSLLAAETLWNHSLARDNENLNWSDIVGRFHHYFSVSRHRFLGRGGELLYTQLCNALRQSSESIRSLASDFGVEFNETEADPKLLYDALSNAIPNITKRCPQALDDLVLFIDKIDGYTAEKTDVWNGRDRKFAWCPEDSWREGYLFAVEFLRLCQAELDPIERIEMLALCCAFQVLRSLCAQSARFIYDERLNSGNGLKFVWAISPPSGEDRIINQVSHRNLLAARELIHNAIRNREIRDNIEKQRKEVEKKGKKWSDPYDEADSRYGDKLFLSLSKKLKFVVPERGPGARFILSDRIMRYLVLALIRPGERCTYDTFKRRLFAHYGLGIDEIYMQKACVWSGYPPLSGIGAGNDAWLVHMLSASGFLIHLSDACSLVENPFG